MVPDESKTEIGLRRPHRMKTILLMVGKTHSRMFESAINDYAKRIAHYMPFSTIVVPEPKDTKNLSENQQKSARLNLSLKNSNRRTSWSYSTSMAVSSAQPSMPLGSSRNSKPHVAWCSSSAVPTVFPPPYTNAPPKRFPSLE